jgi:hypothetical protein
MPQVLIEQDVVIVDGGWLAKQSTKGWGRGNLAATLVSRLWTLRGDLPKIDFPSQVDQYWPIAKSFLLS